MYLARTSRTWRVPGAYLARTWRVPGAYLARTWRVPGAYLARAWRTWRTWREILEHVARYREVYVIRTLTRPNSDP